MKLRAQITIDIEADSYADAAGHQDRIEAIVEKVRSDYQQAALLFRERRDRPARRDLPRAPGAPVHYTGRMHEYER